MNPDDPVYSHEQVDERLAELAEAYGVQHSVNPDPIRPAAGVVWGVIIGAIFWALVALAIIGLVTR